MVGLEDRGLVWQSSLRPLDPGVQDGVRKKKPSWNMSSKKNSPSDITNREGGSLWTARKIQPRPPRPVSPPPPREPTPPPTPSPEPEPAPEPIPWRDRYQFEPLGATLGRTNIIESAIKQIQDENITPIGHYPRDGFVNDHFAESRCSSVLSNKTFTLNQDQGRRSSLSSRLSRSRSGTPGPSPSPGSFSKSTLSTRQKKKESVDYTYGQYQFSELETPPPSITSPRPEPDWERRPSQAFSDDSKMSSFKSFGSSTSRVSSTSSSANQEKKRSSFKKSSTVLNGPMPMWLDIEPARGC